MARPPIRCRSGPLPAVAFSPSLSVNYASNAATGILGRGWSLAGYRALRAAPETSPRWGSKPIAWRNGDAVFASTVSAHRVQGGKPARRHGLPNGNRHVRQDGRSIGTDEAGPQAFHCLAQKTAKAHVGATDNDSSAMAEGLQILAHNNTTRDHSVAEDKGNLSVRVGPCEDRKTAMENTTAHPQSSTIDVRRNNFVMIHSAESI